jgi:hypothetical protein
MKKICIATTIYGACVPEYTWSLIKSVQLLREHNIDVQYISVIDNCYLDAARNKLAQEFLLGGDAQSLLFIDADISWQPEALLRFLRHDEDIVGAVAPYRQGAMGFPVELVEGSEINETGLMEAAQLPTTFLHIKRAVFEFIRANGMAPLHVDIDALTYNIKDKYDSYFQFIPIHNGVIREDICFSRKWKELGGKMWLDPNVTLSHYGRTCRTGKFLDWYSANKADKKFNFSIVA